MSQLEAKGHAADAHAQAHGGEGHDDGQVHAHVGGIVGYVAIFFSLIALTLLTVGVSNIHLGKANLIVAVVIASMKASLVLLFFMHLRYDNKFHGVILIVSLLFIGVFFAYTMNDTNRRGEVDLEQGVKILPSTGATAPGGIPQVAATPAATPASAATPAKAGAEAHPEK